MSGSEGVAEPRAVGVDRFYKTPAARLHQRSLQQQQSQRQQSQQLPKPGKSEAEIRTYSEDSTTALSKPSAVRSSSAPRPAATDMTNLDRLMESVTPLVPTQYLPEANARGWRTREPDLQIYYCLGDLWDSFKEWSAYGVGVPLLLNGKDSIIQYYVPSLSGIQLYSNPLKSSSRIRRHGEESDAESSRDPSSGGSSDCEADRRAKCAFDGSWSRQNHINLNSQQMTRLSLREKSVMSSSSDEAEISSSPGTLVYEYMEQEQPHTRKPLADKVSVLASKFPDIRKYRSCDLLPTSWISVAWYPIYRIPMGPTLRDLDASFLTFHSLSTNSRNTVQPQFPAASGRKGHGVTDASSKIPLPVFGLASYKLKGSILSPSGPLECQQESSLLEAADNWLNSLQVVLPDYQFFRSHWR
ncbi:uncharacterized protein LOC127798734 isoform X2 [Diospyros lotus]|uniref:uncharacterized protein LOC127798734 isoform X2 n=1 Tax=Diospyros lotus TaxID=55363 RepID=UPI0022538E18|nr:uncharacterized protein LOC127798734 isoform X2 [Diospyros lotus]